MSNRVCENRYVILVVDTQADLVQVYKYAYYAYGTVYPRRRLLARLVRGTVKFLIYSYTVQYSSRIRWRSGRLCILPWYAYYAYRGQCTCVHVLVLERLDCTLYVPGTVCIQWHEDPTQFNIQTSIIKKNVLIASELGGGSTLIVPQSTSTVPREQERLHRMVMYHVCRYVPLHSLLERIDCELRVCT